MSFVNSLTLSIPYVTYHSVFSDDLKGHSDSVFADDFWISRDMASLTISCVNNDSIFAINSIHQLVLSFQWWFQGLQWFSFRWWFMDHPSHSIFYHSMRQPWLYFCYWFNESVMNSLTLSIPYVSCNSVFSDDFNVYRTQFSLTIYGLVVT